MTIEVLDRGFVKLLDHMGDDFSAVKAARISHGRDLIDEERDRKLIEYLLRSGHESPFEHIVFTFHIKCPIFVARQWMRHRIASYNELSGRYTELAEEFYLPDLYKRYGERLNENDLQKASKLIEESYKKSHEAYKCLIDMKIPKELARVVLPFATYTQFIWSVNARSLMNFLSLRADSHSQWEMQQFALAVAQVFKSICPWTYESFIRYRYEGDLLKGVNP
ncbi:MULTISPECIES: FAD-dependent thymidylate synthase [Pseudothermotoga]|jgi:thymidylate synthase (FAD)|uniref:Flavin-dependent thymidylate synthase n=1 Tax=Pseudothermotoga lettingae (strain ATCC BAA-301 / DSM 14385 / NBRC 107922 / TMO) TaxID=416591 RepID=THYX_PSELT|nr:MULTISPECIES: FAD-dependent thymidylate synthase [Pseudothermotoga]A8F7Q7.1 RecName: Full=Flavin-dependent thymidylate synthase; Short=FDTS; AltName: Full=FAD-dependent thymidylate synthase; AltName: Full=Thymidylate synthase ThyX; Short=TS; Short=TSase [Pseudothermotoga lettingae TMO]ABV34191.1 thymidylate synthase, flavin-dependent [Pseudothermotoga lettingae TMO]KUK21406.1 MAG: Thymidylate synthase ThyX [Pseudothermotoga lettingae]MDI3494463.1 thymidylate synthase [Pseudothermotoga sp.]M